MSVWHLSSSRSACAAAHSLCDRSGLVASGEISAPGVYGGVYLKRALSTPNLANYRENSWICSAGTIIYDGSLGRKALDACHSAHALRGISGIQQDAIGHYAIAIRDERGISIFVDPQGSLSLFYFCDGDFWFISNSLSLCARALPNRRIDATKLLITAVQSTLPGEDTFYAGIKRLFGSQAIRIDLQDGSFHVIDVPVCRSKIKWDFARIEDAVEAYKAEVESVFQQLSAVGQVGLFGTGGLDSRTVLAGLIHQQARPSLFYATGNSRQTDYDPGDLAVIKQIAEVYGLPFRQLDWSGTQPFNSDTLDRLFDLYGFDYEIYGASDGFLKTLGGDLAPYPELLLGGYSPAFTNAKPWQLPRRLYSFEELVADAMHYQKGSINDSESIRHKETYRETFATEVRQALKREGIEFPDNGADLETFVRAKLFLYIRAESRLLNLVNEFGNYVAPFLLRRLYEPLLSVPFRYRANDEFQIRVIHALSPGLTEIPLFSGWSAARIDPETYRLIRDSQNGKASLLKRTMRRAVPSPVLGAIRRLRSHPQGQPSGPSLASRDAEVVNRYGSEVMSDPLGRRWFSDLSDFSPKEVTRIRHYIAAVNYVGYSE